MIDPNRVLIFDTTLRDGEQSPGCSAGATTINVPDTVGYTVPEEFYEVFSYLRRHVRNAERAVLSVHCHNDLGMAVANSLAVVRAGGR